MRTQRQRWTTRIMLGANAAWVLFTVFRGGGSYWWRVIGVLIAAAIVAAIIHQERQDRRV